MILLCFLYTNYQKQAQEKLYNNIIKPFVKWAGGKSKMLKNQVFIDLINDFDNSKMRYIEPFVGGGAVFLHLMPKNAIINDFNEELINAYKLLSNYENTSKLLDRIDKYYEPNKFDKEFYYNERRLEYEDKINSAARFIYLNKRCFNGLYRVNQKNKFNVPFGKYKTIQFYKKSNIELINKYFESNNIKIFNLDYIKLIDEINFTSNDFIYLDPPYKPNQDIGFTQYTKSDFKDKDQIELMEFSTYLNDLGCKFILHNNDNDYIRKIYSNKDYKFLNANINHTVGGKKETMKKVNEIIITNIK